MHKQIDLVFVATPENTHAAASMMAIKLGKHVYCEKPLTHDIFEARALGLAARQHKVMTQMGNQGHAGEGIRVLREYLEAGAIGTIRETHTWQDQVYGGRTARPTGRCRRAYTGTSGSAPADSASIATACTRRPAGTR